MWVYYVIFSILANKQSSPRTRYFRELISRLVIGAVKFPHHVHLHLLMNTRKTLIICCDRGRKHIHVKSE